MGSKLFDVFARILLWTSCLGALDLRDLSIVDAELHIVHDAIEAEVVLASIETAEVLLGIVRIAHIAGLPTSVLNRDCHGFFHFFFLNLH